VIAKAVRFTRRSRRRPSRRLFAPAPLPLPVVGLLCNARHSVEESLPLSERTDTQGVLDDGVHELIEVAPFENEQRVVAGELDGMALEAEPRRVERRALRDELLSVLLCFRLQLRDDG
jgi:hypothetical protein